MQRLVVVGAGLAGHRAAQAARKAGFAGELVVVGDEQHRPYDRPPLSKQLLAGDMEHDDTFYDSDELDVRWMLGSPAVALDLDGRTVTLGSGESVPYEGLVVATGRRAAAWPELPSLSGFFQLRDLDHTRALREAVSAETKVVIVGAGFIGCEVAATLRGLGVEDVTMVDVAPYPMPVLGAEVGGWAAKLHEAHGVKLLMDSGVESFEGSDGVESVVLRGGERLEADVVLLSLGSKPNTEWLEGSGLELVRGTVRVDACTFAEGAEDVCVVGDIALFPHPLSPDGPICVEHWATARDMGALAARNLLASDAGERKPYVAVPTFWSDQYDVKIKSAGLLQAADTWTVVDIEEGEKLRLIAEAHRGDELVGAVVFNKNRAIIDYTKRLNEALAV